jgi:hypothetical protein
MGQKAVLWTKAGTFDNYGNPVFSEPEEIDCNWKRSRRLASGQQRGTDTVDATMDIKQLIEPGAQVYLGTLETWYGSGSGGNNDLVMIVVSCDECADVRNRVTGYTCALQYAKDQSPS